MQPSSDRPASGSSRQLRRWGPVAAIVVIVAIIASVLVAGGGDDDKQATTSGDGGGGGKTPAGAVSFSKAKADDLDVTFPPTCDEKTGKVAMPYFYAPECYADVDENGGATSPGVTGDTIKVVVYRSQDNDPVLNFITGAIKNDDTRQQVVDTYRGYAELFQTMYQTYGRKIDLQVVEASGTAVDEVAARADAAKVAAMKPFAVWGGPPLTNAWADELAANKIICLGCLGGGVQEWYDDHAPYVLPITASTQQTLTHVAEYVGKKLAKFKARHAGDPALQSRDRRFAYVYIETSAESAKTADFFEKKLKDDHGVELAVKQPYTLDPARLQEQADSIIAKLKSAGVTTVIFSGDPVAPGSFTRQATAQQWFPEWVLGSAVLSDTTVFARTYDQRQWAHAFGPSTLAARVNPENNPSADIYRWFYGIRPPADDTAGVISPQPALFFAAVHRAGPNLTPETFRDGLFATEPFGNGIANPAISYGSHGIWPDTDYNGIDDATEIWWDPTATGKDELRREGRGMYRYVDGGRRNLPGRWAEQETRAFDPAGTSTVFERSPDQVADYGARRQ